MEDYEEQLTELQSGFEYTELSQEIAFPWSTRGVTE